MRIRRTTACEDVSTYRGRCAGLAVACGMRGGRAGAAIAWRAGLTASVASGTDAAGGAAAGIRTSGH